MVAGTLMVAVELFAELSRLSPPSVMHDDFMERWGAFRKSRRKDRTMKDLMAALDALGFAETKAEGLRCLLLGESEAGSETTPETLETLAGVAEQVRDLCRDAAAALHSTE